MLVDWLRDNDWAVRLLVIGAVVLAGVVITWIARRSVLRFERRVGGAHPTGSPALKRAHTLAALLSATATVVIWVVVLITVLEQAGVPVGPLLAAAGIGGIALGFGAQHLVRDLVAGFCILLENQYDVGDEVVVGGVEGTVEAITLRTTVVRSLDGSRHVVSNGEVRVSSNKTKVYSRYVFVLPLPYDVDTDRAVEVARGAADAMRAEQEWAVDMLGPLQVLGIDAFSEHSVDVKLYVETRPGRQDAVGRELRRRLKLALDEADIPLPFPPPAPR